MNKDNILTPEADEEEVSLDRALRPQYLQEFIGQSHIKENLGIFINASRSRKENLDHVILYGPPGLGKTTIAQIIAKEMNSNIKITSGAIISKAGDLAAILTSISSGDVIFIDEIHRLNPHVEEVLYPAMEDYTIDIMIGEGASARSIQIDLPPFTLIGATTRIGLLSNPLRDRFGIPLKLDFYSYEELELIVKRSAHLLNISIDENGAKEIAKRSRGTPRIALRLVRRVRDFANAVYNKNIINEEIAKHALAKLEVDKLGLDTNDRKYLDILINQFCGGPVGIDSLSAALYEQKDSIEETIEPFLIQQGLISRTSRGRIANKIAYDHIGVIYPQGEDK